LIEVLKVNNLKVYYHKVIQALKGLSFEVPEGSIVALLGSNGAGKTTALNAIAGILEVENGEITDGSIYLDDKDISKIPPHNLVRSGLAYTREGRRIFVDLTVHENLIAASNALISKSIKPNYEFIYELFPPLSERKKQLAGYLSGGEQQMLALGRALIGNPKIILMDEPSLGLAPKLVTEIFKVIERINREFKTTILLVEQNANIAFEYADYGYILENGKVVIEGNIENLRSDSDVQEFYLGIGNDKKKSFRSIKHYKRRKRWLS
tara:strand:+ start:274 stop:1071 length:798 start_codon:yes stop_codon:yes gene_type:complete